jgi:DNA-binding transcriptional MocR family regulator
MLPLEAIAESARAQLVGDPLVLQYSARRGHPRFRDALASFLSERYGHPVTRRELAVTGGTSLALSMVSQVFGDPSKPVVCSDPTYFHAAGIFETQRLELVGVPTDDHGLDVDALAERLEAGLRPAFVYCIPSFHNPCGMNLTPERARRLVGLAERYDFLVVADEPYPMLHFGEPPPCMMAFDEGRGRVLALGTMSKILAPGLRLGWVHAAPPLVDRLMDHGALRSGGCINPVITHLVHGTLESAPRLRAAPGPWSTRSMASSSSSCRCRVAAISCGSISAPTGTPSCFCPAAARSMAWHSRRACAAP